MGIFSQSSMYRAPNGGASPERLREQESVSWAVRQLLSRAKWTAMD